MFICFFWAMVANIYYIAVKMGILLSDGTISKVTPGYFSSDTMKEMMYVACFWSGCRFTALRWRLSSAAFDRMHSRFVEIIRDTVIIFFMLKTFFTFSTSNILLIQQFFVCQLVHLMFYFKLWCIYNYKKLCVFFFSVSYIIQNLFFFNAFYTIFTSSEKK